ncbi:MAG: CHAP domain-containing protein [Polyangiales bacterium]
MACEPSPSCYFGISPPRTVGIYGYQYQCVEYVIRFYAEALNYPSLRGTGDAIKYWDAPETAAARGLERYANGGTVAPQPDDMIVFRGGTHRHIAIVRAVAADSVHIIQQNWYHNPEDGDHALRLTVSGGLQRRSSRDPLSALSLDPPAVAGSRPRVVAAAGS